MSCPPLSASPNKSSHFEKGCIHWFDIDGNSDASIQKARPFIIVSRENRGSNRVIVCPITDISNYLEKDSRGNTIHPKKLKYPYHAPLYKSDCIFLDKDSVVLLDQVYTIPKEDLYEDWYMGKVEDMKVIDEAMFYNYDLFDSVSQLVQELVESISRTHTSKYSRR